MAVDAPPRPLPHQRLERRLDRLREQQRWRDPLCLDRRESVHRDASGLPLQDYTANDYLGLSRHPACQQAAADAAARWGCGAGASKLVTGDSPLHRDLEAALCRWLNRPQSLLFPSGYQANLGVIATLARPGWIVYSDERNHASLVDGCRLSRAQVEVYRHGDADHLADRLSRHPGGTPALIVTDALFSMDGDLAPVADLHRLAQRHQALLLVDEAHSLGVLGPEGRGLCAAEGVQPDVLIGTFSKGLGSHGAVAVTDALLGTLLLQTCRSLTYSTALPPPTLGASLAALHLARSAEGDQRRSRVLALADRLRSGLRTHGWAVTGDGTPLTGVPFPQEDTAGALHARLKEQGDLVWAFRPPTVPDGTSLLRVGMSAEHDPDRVDRLAHRLIRCRDRGVLP